MTNGASLVLSEVPGNIGESKAGYRAVLTRLAKVDAIRCGVKNKDMAGVRGGGYPRGDEGGWTEEAQRGVELFPGRGRVVLQKFCDRLVQILLALVRLCFRVEGFAGGTSPYEVFVRGVIHIQRQLSDVDR